MFEQEQAKGMSRWRQSPNHLRHRNLGSRYVSASKKHLQHRVRYHECRQTTNRNRAGHNRAVNAYPITHISIMSRRAQTITSNGTFRRPTSTYRGGSPSGNFFHLRVIEMAHSHQFAMPKARPRFSVARNVPEYG